jgi:hypothetical protein
VNDVEVVRLAERREHLAEHVDDALERQRPLFVDHARQVAAAEELHDDVELAAVLAEVDDGRPSSGGSGGCSRAPR